MATAEIDGFDNSYRVKLISVASLRFSDPSRLEQVVFDVTPIVSESRTVDYSGVTPIHMPGGIQIYKKTNSRTFEISAHLISRNRDDATENMYRLQTLRGWTMPYFGTGSDSASGVRSQQAASDEELTSRTDQTATSDNQSAGSGESLEVILKRLKAGVNLLGAPPDVLYFYAYSKPVTKRGSDALVNLNRIPVVITNLSFDYPEDVDYMPTNFGNKEPMPVKMDVRISLVETHSPVEYQEFSLADYKAGRLASF